MHLQILSKGGVLRGLHRVGNRGPTNGALGSSAYMNGMGIGERTSALLIRHLPASQGSRYCLWICCTNIDRGAHYLCLLFARVQGFLKLSNFDLLRAGYQSVQVSL